MEVKLQVEKEKVDTQAQQNEELQSRLGSAITEWNAFDKELEITKSRLEVTSVDVDEMVAQYKANVKAIEARLKSTAEYMR